MKILFLDPNHHRFEPSHPMYAFYSRTHAGVMTAVVNNNHEIEIFNIEKDGQEELNGLIESGAYKNYDGILAKNYMWLMSKENWRKLITSIPTVNFFNKAQFPDENIIISNDQQSMDDLIGHLVDQDFNNIGFFCITDLYFSRQRYKYWVEAMARHKLNIEKKWVIGPSRESNALDDNEYAVWKKAGTRYNNIERDTTYTAILNKKLPEVFVCARDESAQGFYNMARKLNIPVPERLTFTGFNGTPLSLGPYGYSYLTTVHQRLQEFGQLGVNLLQQIHSGKKSLLGNTVLVPTVLEAKHSTIGVRSTNRDFNNDMFIEMVKFYIHQNYSNSDILNNLIIQLNLSKSYFLQKFNKLFNLPFIQYLNRFRTEMACFKLEETNLPITRIYYETGFKAPDSFLRAFKKYQHCNARSYRSRLEQS